MLITVIYALILILVAVIDIRKRIIPNLICYPAMVFVLTASFLRNDALQSISGGVLGLGVMLLFALLARGMVGWGDVKLSILVGLMVGYPMIIPVIGGAFLLAIILFAIRKKQTSLPFAPFLAAPTMVILAVALVR